MNNLKQLHWPLIAGMGALALIRPFFSITGLMDVLGRPFGPQLVTALISLAWLGIVLAAKVRRPLMTLVFVGLVYGLFALLTSAILSPLLTGELSGPFNAPFGIGVAAVLLTNAAWGGVIGLVARGIMRASQTEARGN